MRVSTSLVILTAVLFSSCRNGEHEKTNIETRANYLWLKKHDTTNVLPTEPGPCELDEVMRNAGLIALEDSVPEIETDLRYSTNKNFMRTDLYGCLTKTYALPTVAKRLKSAQQYLDQKYPGYKLLVFDCARPLRVQQAMWDSVQMPFHKKIKFLSNPALGSLHNYGAAVDLSLMDSLGNELDMGTPYDDTAHLAWPIEEAMWLEKGKLTKQQIANRQILRNAMYSHGFFGIQSEWWHFNFCTREAAIAAGYVQVK